jgi:hypothetical protein
VSGSRLHSPDARGKDASCDSKPDKNLLLPFRTDSGRSPAGPGWPHEVKHDGFRPLGPVCVRARGTRIRSAGSASGLPSLSVERMLCIGRKAVVTAGQAIASLIDRPLALVAIAAERAQRPEPELVVIASMRRAMIGDRGRRDAALLLAQGAERGGCKLVLGPSSPGLQRIPGPPRQRLGGSEITSGHPAKVRLIGGLSKACGRHGPPVKAT